MTAGIYSQIRCFGPFRLNIETGELWKSATKIRLQGQALQILLLLLEEPGRLWTREQLRSRLWSGDTFVDFNHSLNVAVNRLRERLGDSAEDSQYVETVPGIGYRFVAHVERAQPAPPEHQPSPAMESTASGNFGIVRTIKSPAHTVGVALACTAAGVVLVAVSFLGIRFGVTKFSKGEGQSVRLEIALPDEVAMGWLDAVVISPDGRRLAFAGPNTDGKRLLWIRDLDSLQPHPLPDVEGESAFWAPDSRSIGFFSESGKLQRVGAAGGTPITLCDAPGANMGAFSGHGMILFASNGAAGELRSVPETGGQTRIVLRPDKSKGERSLNCPAFLPDGRHFLYFSRNMDRSKTGIYVSTLDSAEPKFVLPTASCAIYAPPGYILYIRNDALIAQPFDAATLKVHEDPFTLTEDFGSWDVQHRRFFSVSDTGVLAYRGNDAPQTQLTWYSREGKRLEMAGERGRYLQLALSPDGTKVTLERLDTTSNTWNLWLLDLQTGVSSRLTSDTGVDTDVVWSPDSREIVYGSDRIGQMDLFRRTIGTTQDRLLYADGNTKVPESWTTAGDIVYMTDLRHVYLLKADGSRKPVPLFTTGFQSDEPHVSPDGRWIAYGSVESGRWDIYVASFPDFQNKLQVSNGGGAQALWRADGAELYYLTLDGKMMVTETIARATLKTGIPKFLFETSLRHPKPVLDQFAVSPDGQKFLVAEPVERVAKPITIVLNWPSAIRSDHAR
ncbi:MAG TPA: winged helix-turn-helix domain-containing protein [Bryobacteraceae bacterium]